MSATHAKAGASPADANRDIRRLLKQRDKHIQTLEAAADNFAEGLGAMDKVGRAIRHIRSKHLGPEGASDHLISVSLHSRVQRYLGRKLAHVIGLGFEGKNDGTEPAPWVTWEAVWTSDLLLPASDSSSKSAEKKA